MVQAGLPTKLVAEGVQLKLGIVKEIRAGENRVAVAPKTVQKLVGAGFDVLFEGGAGAGSNFTDAMYERAGATVVEQATEVWSTADIVVKLHPPAEHPEFGHEADLIREGATLISFLYPAQEKELIERLGKRKASAIGMACIPRITRAQKCDALSSLANIAGYRAVVEASQHFGSFFTGQFTAAGRVAPAKVLIIGAGVAGLAALGAARGLGAIVRAFDTREATKEQVESLGGEFLVLEFEESGEGEGGYGKVMSKEFIEAEMALFADQAVDIDIVITTALIPGRKAPILWTAEHVQLMKPGSVIVDLAARQGGNCELTKPGEVIVEHGVTIVGYRDLSNRMAAVASELYGTNLWHVLDEMGGAKDFAIDLENDIVRPSLVLHEGELMWPAPKPEAKDEEPAKAKGDKPAAKDASDKPPSAAGAKKTERKATARPAAKSAPVARQPSPVDDGNIHLGKGTVIMAVLALIVAGGWVYLRLSSADDRMERDTFFFLQHLTVFVLSCFVGWQVVWNVTAALHTPLMSVTNAISGIIIVGGILQAYDNEISAPLVIGAIATLFAMINIVGGFFVTQRMLRMFRK